MREIKFRAVITPHKTVITFTLEDLVNSKPLFSIRELVIPWLRAGNKPDDYTGLKDKNGKEIYEGDRVEKWSHCSLLERLSPLYNGGVGYYRSLTTTVKWSEQGLNYNIYPHHDDSYWEVIGNIYENQELIKEEL